MAFKAYVPPVEDPNNDWTDTLTTKVLPIAGGAVGAYFGGPSGAVAGYGLGSAAGGLFNPKKGSEMQAAAGVGTGLMGWQAMQQEEAAKKAREAAGEAQTGKDRLFKSGALSESEPEPSALSPNSSIESFYAKRTMQDEDKNPLTKQFSSGLSNKYNIR